LKIEGGKHSRKRPEGRECGISRPLLSKGRRSIPQSEKALPHGQYRAQKGLLSSGEDERKEGGMRMGVDHAIL